MTSSSRSWETTAAHYTAAETPGNLWLLTQKGIARFTPATGVVRNYGPAEGVPIAAADFVHVGFKNRKGYLYFGGSNGLVVFHPDSIHDHTFIPPIAITSFKKFNNEVALDSATTAKRIIELSYDENVISFAFAALNYVRPEKNQYAYMLEGFDRDWVYCGTRRTTMYTNLDPGAYVFRVKGSNNEGVWNEAGASLVLIVHPPFWKTWWAYLLYALFTMALLYSAFRFQHNRLILRHEVEVKEVETRKLKEVNEIKSRFFANISHEFRTPLTLILGPIHKWQERVQEEGLKKDLSMAERNAHRLLRLINQLLDLSKLEVGGMKLHARCMNIVPLVKGIAYSFESSAGIRGITLKVSVDHDERQAYCDKDVIENFLTNLLSNAMKFTPKGGSVGVTVKRVTERGEFVEIGVSDTGIGIAEEHLTHIFDRFYQVDDSTTREQGGTGIGLALVKELVELHHGSISVESSIGEGTTFTVRLPSAKEHFKAEEIDEPLEEDKAPAEEFRPGGLLEGTASAPISRAPEDRHSEKQLILVVEDNGDVREYIKGILPDCYRVLEARDGLEGVERAWETIPDLVISDVMMPKKDGYELCRMLKTDERTSHIPIILLTAKAASENKLEGLETGADDYLIKPFEPKELQVRIKNLIELRRKLRERFRVGVPLKPGEVAVTSMDDVFLKKVMVAVEQHMGEEHFHTDDLAKEVGLSRVQLHRKLTALTNQPPGDFIRYLRLHRAMELIEKNAGTISEIAYNVGFNDPSYFSKCFHKQFGKVPTEVKNRVSHVGQAI